MNEQIRPARPEDEKALKYLWKATFGDGDEYINGFFSHMFRPDSTILAQCDGRIVSAAHVLNVGKIGETPVGVTYAFSTLTEYRSRGIGGRVSKCAADMALENGLSALCPAEPSLFRFYKEKCGYEAFFYIDELEGEAESSGKVKRINADKYNALREEYLSGRMHITLTDDAVRYQEFLCNNTGGGLYSAVIDGAECRAAVEVYGEKAVIKELLAPADVRRNAAAAFAGFAGGECYIARVPAESCDSGRAFAMVLSREGKIKKGEKPAWFGFAFD